MLYKYFLGLIFLLTGFHMSSQHMEVEGKVRISVMDTVTGADANLVRQADGTLAIRKFKIGDYAHGGIVFYVNDSGEHGLVCDKEDISINAHWYNGVYRITNATADGIGAGELNTALIIAMQTADNPSGDFAALQCANSTRSGFGDWYLPSLAELNLMYQNKQLIDSVALSHGGDVFTNNAYWSSTETDSVNCYLKRFTNGEILDDQKEGGVYHDGARAIRKFD